MESSTDPDFDEEEDEEDTDTDSVESDRLYENIVNRSKTTVEDGNGPLYHEEGNGGGPLYENIEALTLENPSLRRRPRPTRRFDYNFLILMISQFKLDQLSSKEISSI